MSLEQLSQQSALLQLLSAFGFGFLSSFTPCIFPLIPITLTLFGVSENTSRKRGFLLACSYVGGIAVTYTGLGMLSAKTGMVFGGFLGNPYVVACLDIFLIAIALYSLEALNFKFLSSLQTSASKIGGVGMSGAFLMGAASGFVAAPCVGPALILILGFAAASENVAWGAALLFSYSLGLGVIFLFLGTFSQYTKKLPKSGNWLHAVKFIMAVALLMVVIFLSARYLQPLRSAFSLDKHLLTLLFLENLAIYLAWYSYRHNRIILRIIAAFLMAFSLYQLTMSEPPSASSSESSASELVWLPSIENAIEQSKATSQIAMIDLFADWCTACKELDHKTFSDVKVQENLSKLVLARVDFTDTETPTALAITEKYSVAGLPCILFLKADGSGEEIKGTRITGFMNPQEFLAHLEKVRKSL